MVLIIIDRNEIVVAYIISLTLCEHGASSENKIGKNPLWKGNNKVCKLGTEMCRTLNIKELKDVLLSFIFSSLI